MVTRLSPSDASFYRLENTATPMYVGSLSILRRPRAGLSYEALLATVEQRLAQIPRYRQKVRAVIGMARPVCVTNGSMVVGVSLQVGWGGQAASDGRGGGDGR